jgi:hypothetical protein
MERTMRERERGMSKRGEKGERERMRERDRESVDRELHIESLAQF